MYYLTPKVAQVRNLSVSVVNGAISLIILLIAPMGLFAVIINTLLIIASTYAVTTASDRIIMYLERDRRVELLPRDRNSSDLDR